MKNIIYLLFFCSVGAHAQNLFVAGGFDVKNAIFGSKPTNNKPALDVVIEFGMIGGKTEIVVGYEEFKDINFDKFSFGVGHRFRINDKFILIPSIEPSLIGRWGLSWQTISSHLTLGASVALRYKLSNSFSLELQSNVLPRTDLMARYPDINQNSQIIISNYLKIIYRLPLGQHYRD